MNPFAKHLPFESSFQPARAYSSDEETASIFRNFDDADNFEQMLKQACNPRTRNFVLDFNAGSAYSAFDVDARDLFDRDESQIEATSRTRWINIWGPSRQVGLVEALSERYGFAPRLSRLMCDPPPSKLHNESASRLSTSSRRSRWRSRSKLDLADVEKLVRSDAENKVHFNDVPILNHWDLVRSSYHWSSVDLGKRYFCMGYNALHDTRSSRPEDKSEDLPEGQRIWTWLILCDDKTVISITEDAYENLRHLNASLTRRNLLNVFSQISKAYDPAAHNTVALVSIRPAEEASSSASISTTGDTPGLLFYYLFDDWYSGYSLLAKQGRRYGAELTNLRNLMMEHPRIEHVNLLHHMGRRLASLKRLYQSYDQLISHLLGKQSHPDKGEAAICSRPVFAAIGKSNDKHPSASVGELGVWLTPTTRERFERLRDRIRLYALSEIQDCIEMKESLFVMNFNLISLRESNSVDRFTRVTVLLSKATILFLPVSLLTAYAGLDLAEGEMNIRKYWVTFAILLSSTFVFLVLFGLFSHTFEGPVILTSIRQGISECLHGRSEEEEDDDKEQRT